MRNPYEVFGVDPSANLKEIKKIYREMVKDLHPDHFPDDLEKHERFAEVKTAYEILSDPSKRAEFDTYGEVRSDNMQLVNDVVNMFIGHLMNPHCFNPLNATREQIRHKIKNLKGSIVQKNRDYDTMMESMKKLKGDGPFIQAVNNSIMAMKDQIRAAEKSLDLVNWQLEFLENYDFEDTQMHLHGHNLRSTVGLGGSTGGFF